MLLSVKKKPFILLEILIAIGLIALCAVPLIVRPLQLYQKEMNFLWEIEAERLADWTFSEIKEKLLKNEIPWKKLPDKKKGKETFTLPDAFISLPEGQKKKVQRKFTLKCKREREGLKEEIYRMYEVKIYFTPKLISQKKKQKYLYRVLIQKLPLPKEGKVA